MDASWVPPVPRSPKLRAWCGMLEGIPGAVGGCFTIIAAPMAIAFVKQAITGSAGWGPAAGVSAFLLVGLGVGAIGVVPAMRKRALLVRGTATAGKIVSAEPSNTSINDVPVPEVTFAFETMLGTHTAKRLMRTHPPVGAQVAVVYDPQNPKKALIVDPADFS